MLDVFNEALEYLCSYYMLNRSQTKEMQHLITTTRQGVELTGYLKKLEKRGQMPSPEFVVALARRIDD